MINADTFWKNFTDKTASYTSENERKEDLDRRLNEEILCRIYAEASATQTADDVLRRYQSEPEFNAKFNSKLQSKLSKMNQEYANQFTQRVIEEVFHIYDQTSHDLSYRASNNQIDADIYGIYAPTRSHEACRLFDHFIKTEAPKGRKEVFKMALVQCAVKHQLAEAKKGLFKGVAHSSVYLAGTLLGGAIILSGAATLGLSLLVGSVALFAVFSAYHVGRHLYERNKIQKPLKDFVQSTPKFRTSLALGGADASNNNPQSLIQSPYHGA